MARLARNNPPTSAYKSDQFQLKCKIDWLDIEIFFCMCVFDSDTLIELSRV